MTKSTRDLAVLLLLASITPLAVAEVSDAEAAGFGIELERTLPVPPEQAWRSFVLDVGQWWSPAHTYSGDAGAMSIDPRPGGCFCEAFSDRGAAGPGVQHMTVSLAWPGRELRLLGGLGPLQGLGVSGAMSISFVALASGDTRVRLGYRVAGHAPEGLASWAAPVDGVLSEQLDRFVRHASGAAD